MVDMATKAYNRLELDAHRRRAISTHGNILARALDYEGSISVYETLLNEAPNDMLVRGNLGALYQAVGRLNEARQHLDVTVRLQREQGDYRGELISLNNVIPIDLVQDERGCVELRLKRIEELYNILGDQNLYRYISLRNRALHMHRHGSLLEAYHMISEAFECDHTRIDAMAMRVAMAAYLGFLDEAERELVALRQSPHTLESQSFMIYAELATRCGHALHDSSYSGDTSTLLKEIKDAQDAPYSCLAKLLFLMLATQAESLARAEFTLWVGPQGLWARSGSQQQDVDLRRSSISRQLLRTLIAHHQSGSHEPCAIQTLFEAAWPEQVWNLSAYSSPHRDAQVA